MDLRRFAGFGLAGLLAVAAVFYFFEAEKAPPPAPADLSKEFSLSQGKAYFLDNRHVGRLYVIESEVTNNTSGARCQIAIKATILDASGNVVQEARPVAGVVASMSELRFLNQKELDAKLTPQGADPCAATRVPPGGKAPVLAVFRNPPADAAQYSLAVVDSQSPQ